MPFAVKMGLNGTGFAGKPESSLRNQRKFKSRRRTLPGFPKTQAFESVDHVKKYMSGDSITCLLCGKQYKSLGVHLLKIHGVSPDKYKLKFGIPWTYSLMCEASVEKKSEQIKKRIAEPEQREKIITLAEYARSRKRGTKRKIPDCVRKMRVDRIVQATRVKLFCDDDFELFLKRLGSGRTPKEVASDDDMPSLSVWRKYRRDNPSYAKRFMEVWDRLPFSVQARAQMLGPRFLRELRLLFNQGLSDHEASHLLGVTAMACNRHTKKWRQDRTNDQ